ncbi:hypothetical protein [Parasphingopyxis sp.]|uniref:hypothetical protein n=1 Tax=Parasphingopyxis sp. TaxID=1920299 RepID=UPI0032EB651F
MASKYPDTTVFRAVAYLQQLDGKRFRLTVSPDCVKFVGRFAQLDELRCGNGVIRFETFAAPPVAG